MAAFELTVDEDMLLWLRNVPVSQDKDEPVFHGFFPTEDVAACLDVPIDPMLYKGRQACPICQRPAYQLQWMRYSSPAQSWSRGGGVIGALSVCTKCQIQVQFLSDQY